MSASKEAPPTSQMVSPRAAVPQAVPPEDGQVVLIQEKVLAEIHHELGNLFHKLYYWSDFLKERPSRQSTDSTAAQMLERTIKNLEDFLKVSLEYFHPQQLSFIRMAVPELVHGLLCQVRANLNGTRISVAEGTEWQGGEVLIDPGHLSQAFEVAVRHLTMLVGPESSLRIAIERSVRRDASGLEVTFQLDGFNEASPLFRTSEAGVEWALAQKLVALHGGELVERAQERGEKNLVLFLPLCA